MEFHYSRGKLIMPLLAWGFACCASLYLGLSTGRLIGQLVAFSLVFTGVTRITWLLIRLIRRQAAGLFTPNGFEDRPNKIILPWSAVKSGAVVYKQDEWSLQLVLQAVYQVGKEQTIVISFDKLEPGLEKGLAYLDSLALPFKITR